METIVIDYTCAIDTERPAKKRSNIIDMRYLHTTFGFLPHPFLLLVAETQSCLCLYCLGEEVRMKLFILPTPRVRFRRSACSFPTTLPVVTLFATFRLSTSVFSRICSHHTVLVVLFFPLVARCPPELMVLWHGRWVTALQLELVDPWISSCVADGSLQLHVRICYVLSFSTQKCRNVSVHDLQQWD